MYCINDLMTWAGREAAEEFHLEAGQPPVMVLQGKARSLDLPPLTEDNVVELFRGIANPEQIEELRRCGDVTSASTISFGTRRNLPWWHNCNGSTSL